MTVAARVQSARVLLSASALIGALLVALTVQLLVTASGAFAAASAGPIIGGLAGLIALFWCRGVFSGRRVVLWLEERVPTLRFALAALLDAPDTPVRPLLEARVRETRFGRVLSVASLRLIGIPLTLLIASRFVLVPFVSSLGAGRDARPGSGDRASSRPVAATLRYTATVTPPSYARQGARTFQDPTSIAALIGSGLQFSGAFSMRATMPARPTILRLESGNGNRLVALEPRTDSAPRVMLELPARDTVIVNPTGTLRLAASARDDIGIVAGWFELIVSSGTGESFTFRSAALGRTDAAGRRELALGAVLPLDSLQLKPGDVVHLRAVARDANPLTGTEPGSSETRTLRVPRPSESDSLAIDALPPPEVGRSELSQRMLIILTERLVTRMRSISAATLGTEAGSIAREQARLRKRVGEIIFTRLTGEDRVDEEAAAAMNDTLSPGEALLKAASEATDAAAQGVEHEEGEDGPVINVNRPLLEAFNAMWEAERRLHVSEPRQALPHMRAALDAIQRARAAERLYLRGRAPKIVLDLARIRLTGKRDGIDPAARSPRASALDATLARRARFANAVDLLAAQRLAAVDSLLLIRIDAIADAPALAAALGAAIDDLRAGRNATASLVTAHRLIAGKPSTTSQTRWSGAW